MNEIMPVTLSVRTPDVRAIFERQVTSVPGFAIDDSGRTEGLLIHEVGEDAERELDDLRRLMERGKAREVFLTARLADQDILLEAMRAGVKEFFPQPLDEGQIRPALWRLKERKERLAPDGRRRGLVINVMGARPGAGVTTLAVNLAGALLKTPGIGSAVLADLNVSAGEAHHFLDLKPQYSWAEALRRASRPDAAWLAGILARHPSGLRLLPSPSRLEDLDGDAPERLAELLSLLTGMFDVVVLDGGDYLDDLSLRALELSDVVLFVVTQGLPYLVGARRSLRFLARDPLQPEDRVRVVLNRRLKGCELTDQDIGRLLDKEIFWRLPNDYQTASFVTNQGQTLAEAAARSALGRSVADLAQALARERGLAEAGQTLLGLPLPRALARLGGGR